MANATESITIYPVFNMYFLTAEHPHGQLDHLGDAIGRDFMGAKFVNGFMRMYQGDGSKNEDWFCYKAEVMAPCDAIVKRVNINHAENEPGKHTNNPCGSVVFNCEDGTRIFYGHLTDIMVEPGERVTKGEVFARCGNNGTSWNPHVHVGAWRGDKPLQIQVDLVAMGEIEEKLGENYYFVEGDTTSIKRLRESFEK